MTFKRYRWVLFVLTLVLVQVPSGFAQKVAKLKMSFVKIKAGQFMMGCSKGDVQCAEDEKPSHQVKITKPFEIGRYEVTQDDWLVIMGNKPANFNQEGWAERPVEQVSWNDVQAYLQKLNDRHDGFHYRLPSEAEWEFAARGGNTMPHSAAGDVSAWSGENSNGHPSQIGKKLPNFSGLYDVEGNVWEWVQDWYDPTFYQNTPPVDPLGPASGQGHVIRGGAWNTSSRETRLSARGHQGPDAKDLAIGFRVVREVAAP